MTGASHSLEDFLRADTDVRFAWFRNEEVDHDKLRRYFGDNGYREYAALVSATPEHLASPLTNLIFVPGAMGSLLHNESLGGVWWIDYLNPRRITGLRLANDGVTDFVTDYSIRPFSVHTSYDPFRQAIIADDRFRHRAYPYDWRKSVRNSAAGLRQLIEETHADNGGEPVHLVAYSMGGLVTRAMLTWEADDELWSKIGRIAFIATPHFGSPTIAGYLKHHLWGWEQLAALGFFLTREAFRSMWGVLNLLPAPSDVYPKGDLSPAGVNPLDYRHPCTNFDLYRASEWELGLSAEDQEQLQRVLTHAAETHRALDAAHRNLSHERRERMLTVAGVGYRTLFRLAKTDGVFSESKSRCEFGRIAAHPHRDGDGRVPVASAQLPGVRAGYVRGVHDRLLNLPDTHSTVLNWLAGEDQWSLADTPEAAYDSSHLAANPTAVFTQSHSPDDDPGWWQKDLNPAELETVLARIERGEVPDFARVHIL